MKLNKLIQLNPNNLPINSKNEPNKLNSIISEWRAKYSCHSGATFSSAKRGTGQSVTFRLMHSASQVSSCGPWRLSLGSRKTTRVLVRSCSHGSWRIFARYRLKISIGTPRLIVVTWRVISKICGSKKARRLVWPGTGKRDVWDLTGNGCNMSEQVGLANRS